MVVAQIGGVVGNHYWLPTLPVCNQQNAESVNSIFCTLIYFRFASSWPSEHKTYITWLLTFLERFFVVSPKHDTANTICLNFPVWFEFLTILYHPECSHSQTGLAVLTIPERWYCCFGWWLHSILLPLNVDLKLDFKIRCLCIVMEFADKEHFSLVELSSW